ncbi:membrane protein [Paenibacillus sp. 32O-W]|uniref:YetF domain-containing protein n=1 Tax=Paenibacillus sp. 32O-W TaxID=1695218 RepID=UPI0007208EE5|nr:DUF421 domain-containing protein [Paenibacillus sp. 32O-W]ALS27023.1 membrane protein [Paenibacillus sp. 32O-W]
MEYLLLLFRTLVIYFVVFLTVRLMGKREIGKLSVFDLIISFMIAEIAVIVIEDVKRPIWDGVLPMALLVAIQIATAFLALKSRTVRRLLDGKPSVIIAKGQLNREAMRKERYNIDDLTSQLRENQLSSPDDVEFAILETNGKLSIVKKNENENAQQDASDPHRQESGASGQAAQPMAPSDMFRFESLPVSLIMDGQVQDEHLQQLGKSRFWLKNELRRNGVSNFRDVFFCSIDHEGKLYINTYRKHNPNR